MSAPYVTIHMTGGGSNYFDSAVRIAFMNSANFARYSEIQRLMEIKTAPAVHLPINSRLVTLLLQRKDNMPAYPQGIFPDDELTEIFEEGLALKKANPRAFREDKMKDSYRQNVSEEIEPDIFGDSGKIEPPELEEMLIKYFGETGNEFHFRFKVFYVVFDYERAQQKAGLNLPPIRLTKENRIDSSSTYFGVLFPAAPGNEERAPELKVRRAVDIDTRKYLRVPSYYEYNATKRGKRAAGNEIFRRYNLLERNALKSPWVDFDDNTEIVHDPNCVIDCIISRWCRKGLGSAALSVNLVKKWWKDKPTTIQNLIEFAKKKKTGLQLINMYGVTFYHDSHGCSPKSKRGPLCLVICDNHVYPRAIGSCIKHLKFKPEINDDNKHEYAAYPAAVGVENAGFWTPQVVKFAERFAGMKSSSWQFEAETQIHANAEFWQVHEHFNGCSLEPASSSYARNRNIDDPRFIAIDMIKCYYTVVMHLADENDEIAIFSVFDTWQHRTSPGFPLFSNIPECAMVVLDDKFEPTRENYFCNSQAMTYNEAKRRGLRQHIAYIKVPSKIITVKDLREKISALRAEVASMDEQPPTDDDIAGVFSVLSGILGKCRSGGNQAVISNSTHESELSKELDGLAPAQSDEIELIEYTLELAGNERVQVAPLVTKTPTSVLNAVRCSDSGRHRYITNRNSLYDFIISRANIAMCDQIDEFQKKNPTAVLCRIVTDSMTWKFPTAEEAAGAIYDTKIFKPEPAKYNTERSNIVRTVDMQQVISGCVYEFSQLVKNTQTVLAPPGYGKSHMAMTAKPEYRFAPTYAAANNINGQTVHKGLRIANIDQFHKSMNKFKGKTVLFDEISMIEPVLFNYVIYAASRAKHAILAGDFNQAKPIEGRVILDPTKPLDAYGPGTVNDYIIKILFPYAREYIEFEKYEQPEQKPLVFEPGDPMQIGLIAGYPYAGDNPFTCKMTVLRSLKRATNDADGSKLINIRRDAINRGVFGGVATVSDVAQITDPDIIHICYTNKRRNFINQAILDANDLKFTPTFISKGVKLIARVNNKEGLFFNGAYFRLAEDWTGGLFKLEPITANLGKLEIKTLECFDIGYAITSHCAQSQTFHGKVVVHQAATLARVDKGLLNVAISRANNPANLYIAGGSSGAGIMDGNKMDSPNHMFKKQLTKMSNL